MNSHEEALQDAQADVEAVRPAWDAVLEKRRRAVAQARADDVSIYRIARILGVKENAVRQILGLRSGKGPLKPAAG
jgi:DNA-directed RNA polymerase specialized sigma24 family protein